MRKKEYVDFLDHFDGGGAGQTGDSFQGGGLLSALGNIFATPYGSEDEERRAQRRQALGLLDTAAAPARAPAPFAPRTAPPPDGPSHLTWPENGHAPAGCPVAFNRAKNGHCPAADPVAFNRAENGYGPAGNAISVASRRPICADNAARTIFATLIWQYLQGRSARRMQNLIRSLLSKYTQQ